ncbi:hypothetical protein LSTR_LSTR006545 [Laodelphax striatellus]|uniref:Uncharacterized protein n=1 Tax=Laodelphax striatellus TaxID=195883 RepID=A0A482WGS3_LAOST|nr:hypothetical protein LSTR_LSTR006545 [Laodelphax striatellus]
MELLSLKNSCIAVSISESCGGKTEALLGSDTSKNPAFQNCKCHEKGHVKLHSYLYLAEVPSCCCCAACCPVSQLSATKTSALISAGTCHKPNLAVFEAV